MKPYPAFCFYGLALLSVVLAVVSHNKTYDITMHDTYLIMNYDGYFLAIALLSILTGLVYSLMHKLKKPIANKTGLLHFVFIVVGLLFSITIFRIYYIMTQAGAPDTTALAGGGLVILLGPISLLIGLLIFIYGIVRAIIKSK